VSRETAVTAAGTRWFMYVILVLLLVVYVL
jgi:hypothetical protein